MLYEWLIQTTMGYMYNVHALCYRKAWVALGDMTKVDSQLEIIKLLEAVDLQMKEIVLERWRAKQSKEEKEKSRYDSVFSPECTLSA